MSTEPRLERTHLQHAMWPLIGYVALLSVASVLHACGADDLSSGDILTTLDGCDVSPCRNPMADAQPILGDVSSCSFGEAQCIELSDDALNSATIDAIGEPVAEAGFRIEAPLLRVGEFGRFRLVRGSGGPAPGAVEWTTDGPDRLGISAKSGLGRAIAPGAVTVFARHEEGVTEATFAVTEFPGLGAELLSVTPLSLGVAAAQGLLQQGGSMFTSFNSVDRGPCVAALDTQLLVTREACFVPDGWPGAHVGSLASIGQGLLLPYMHLDATPFTGLRVIDRDTFATTAWYDTSDRYRYLDAIDVADGYLWIDTFEVFVRVPLSGPGAEFPEFDAAVVFRRSIYGVLQGLRVRHGRIWAMPESTTTHPSLMGLHAYDLSSLEPESKADFAATLNSPVHIWRFGYPAEEPDHEGFEFEPGSTDRISFPVIPTNQVHRLALDGE